MLRSNLISNSPRKKIASAGWLRRKRDAKRFQFVGVDQSKEKHRQARGLPMLDILRTCAYTFRTLRPDSGLSLTSPRGGRREFIR